MSILPAITFSSVCAAIGGALFALGYIANIKWPGSRRGMRIAVYFFSFIAALVGVMTGANIGFAVVTATFILAARFGANSQMCTEQIAGSLLFIAAAAFWTVVLTDTRNTQVIGLFNFVIAGASFVYAVTLMRKIPGYGHKLTTFGLCVLSLAAGYASLIH